MPANRIFIERRHGPGQPFCEDIHCPCHARFELLTTLLIHQVRDGFMTGPEAIRLYENRHIDLTSQEGETTNDR